MKASVLVTALLPLASAWKLQLWTTDKRHVTAHGTTNSGCKNLAFSPVLNVNKLKFEESAFADTVELYVNKNCDGLSYRNDGGTYNIKARKIRSYKVY
ncbi:hypothetical protein MYCTH_2301722 [Thermothelomyces thermophilus ATCC 42464]|uniref:Uncharacterized protein n=1 Tax=Thermothelomyces thermophilus (strain ATCC 42464 / BCRC 31852 / DSM 1799) TaxID=573729 RepID=G2QA13_THET4|nr:uncharacterized protein MYCTH_2301722 [Thermothelomyces thermophilus ATCC 42464]AEO56617.1 hypothetical protein MYCTH_2301722 [Thermothelomyces thermophilus ATCC 42464]